MNQFGRSVSELPDSIGRNRPYTRAPVWLYSHYSMNELAKNVAKRCEGCSVSNTDRESAMSSDKDNVSRRAFWGKRIVEYKDTIKWTKFNDGFPNLFIEDVKKMAGKDVIFLASFHTPEVIFEQLSVIFAIPRYLARSFTLILPYFPTGTMERVDTEGQIATAKSLATMLSSTPLTARGPSQIMIFDIHALQERFYFTESVIPRLESAIPLLQRKLAQLPDTDNVAIAFPDDGAHKRFSNYFTQQPTIICFKIREGEKRIVKIKDGEPRGHHVVIVDDLVQTGGTLIECARALYSAGATKVSAYVTHAVFPQKSWTRFTESQVKFEHFWITDSLPHAPIIAQNPPFSLLSLADSISEVLLGYDLIAQD